MDTAVYFRGGRTLARDIARRLVLILTGQEADSLQLARGVFTAVGFQALSDVKDDYIRKARGAVGEDGVQWPPLDPKTIAYHRRFGPGEKSNLKKAAGLGRGNRLAPGGKPGLLTTQQLKRWRGLYASMLARFLLSMSEREAKSKAAAIAWATLKREGAKTMLEVFGSRQVEILRDTGILLNSLSPGQISGSGASIVYTKPTGDGGAEQIFDLFESGVIIGTTVKYAATHQNGDKKRGIPARPFLPQRIPQAWLERWTQTANQATQIAARMLYEGAA